MLAASFCSASQLRKLFWLTNYLNSGINCTSLGVVKRETRIPCLAVTTICAVSHLLLCFMVLGGTKEKSQQTSFQSKANEWFWYLKLIDEELKATDGLYWVLLCFLRKWKHVTCFISPQREVGIAELHCVVDICPLHCGHSPEHEAEVTESCCNRCSCYFISLPSFSKKR